MRKLIILSVIAAYLIPKVYSQALNTQVRSNWDDESLILDNVVYNDIWGYADDNGREYAIMGSRLFTHFVDVTDPEVPVEVDREEGGTSCLWRDYKVYGHYAYGVSDHCGGGLEIFDLSTLPDSVHKVYDSNEFVFDTHNIFIDTAGGKLYACGFSSTIEDIVILDLTTDPSNPALIKNLVLPEGYVHDLYVRNDTAYCSHIWSHRLIIYDFTDLENISSIGIFESDRFNHSSWLSDNGNTIVVADESSNRPVLVADVSDKESPVQISTFKSTLLAPLHTNSIAHNPFFVGDKFVVLSYYDDGLQIYNLNNPEEPFQAAYYDTDTIGTSYDANGAWGAYAYLPSGNILASDVFNGLYVITPLFPLRDCEPQVNISGDYSDEWNFISSDRIATSGLYHSQARINLFAPEELEFKAGFEIKEESELIFHLEDQCPN